MQLDSNATALIALQTIALFFYAGVNVANLRNLAKRVDKMELEHDACLKTVIQLAAKEGIDT